MSKKKKVIKRKFKWKTFLKILSFFMLFVVLYLLLYFLPTRHINVVGNKYVSDMEVIRLAGFADYPNLFEISNSSIISKLKENPYFSDVKVKKSILGELTIIVDEAKPLFYNRETGKLVLSNKNEIETTKLEGVPILNNHIPDNIYDRFVTSLNDISDDVLDLISEIIYSPWKNDDVVIDETRFFMKMNDGNHVYANLIHLNKLNNYIEIYATLEGKKGILYLDSSSDKISFSLF